jgi:four helix bundle protein
MKTNAIKDKSFAFAVRIVNLSRFLNEKKNEYVISRQILRSGTAVGALVREAEQGESKPDFIHKLAIALKEASETEYWLLLLRKAGYISATEAESIMKDNKEMLKLLTSIIKSAKRIVVN